MSEESAQVAEVSYAVPADAPESMSVSEAARMLSQARRAKAEPPAESAPQATAETELAQEADAAPQNEATGETQETDPAELPPLDLPRSWTKEQAEHWNALPRATQEYLSERASKDSEAVRRSQNEAAEAKKVFEAKMAEMDQLREKYVKKIADENSAYERDTAEKFPNIKSMADVKFLANQAITAANGGDHILASQINAYLAAWDAHQKDWATIRAELSNEEQSLSAAKQTKWTQFVQQESKAFADETPEFRAKEAEYTKKAATILSDLGFTNDELNRLATGDDKIALYDRRLQRLLFDRIRLDEIKAAPAKAIPKPVPPVQRPGVKQGGAPSSELQIQNLETQLAKATGNAAIRLAAQLTQAKRAAAAR